LPTAAPRTPGWANSVPASVWHHEASGVAQDRSDMLIIRVATAADAARIAAIYAPFVTDTVVSFETTPPDAGEMRRRIEASMDDWPWLVCVRGEAVCGYAYASKHRAREAYQWCCECSAYVDAPARRRGVGRALYRSLFAVLEAQGYRNVYAGIAQPNAASESFHANLGFTRIGTYERIGYKLGAWRDVTWWALRLGDAADAPPKVISFGELRSGGNLDRLLAQPA